jgi:hypothetical protein
MDKKTPKRVSGEVNVRHEGQLEKSVAKDLTTNDLDMDQILEHGKKECSKEKDTGNEETQ